MSAATSTAADQLAAVEYKPAFAIAVCGSGVAPPGLVARVLDQVYAPRQHSHFPLVVSAGGEEPAALWARRTYRGSVTHESPTPQVYGRTAHARWAMAVAAIAEVVVVFGDDRRWWRLLRYAREIGTPVRRVAIPAGHAPPRRAVTGIRNSVPPATVLDGAGPGGYPD